MPCSGRPPSSSPGDRPDADACASSQATRIQFAQGATSATITSHLAAGDMDSYVLRASKDQMMIVSVGAPKGDAVLEIYGLSDGRWLVRSTARQTSWQGVLPATQDYGINVVSVGGNTPYTLQVTIPRRVQFAPGAISASVAGAVAAWETNSYLLRASAGQTMTVTIKTGDPKDRAGDLRR